jgi:hypothetical protein
MHLIIYIYIYIYIDLNQELEPGNKKYFLYRDMKSFLILDNVTATI